MNSWVTHKGILNLYRVYGATLFFAVHIALITYIHSTYLEQFVPADIVGVLYTIGALLGIIGLSHTSHLLRLFGNKRFLIALIFLELACLSMIGFSENSYLIVFFFVIHQAIVPMMYFTFDIFIKCFSHVKDTGESRGIYLSIVNAAYVAIPILTGIVLSYGSFRTVYGLSLLMLLPLIFFIGKLKHFKDPEYHDINLTKSLRASAKNRNLFSITMVNFVLQMFYAVMVIYMPLFLHQHIGFDWPTIGLIFTIMLTPFIIFELPLGKISDAWLGERELLIIGLVIMAIATASVPFLNSRSVIAWTALLFMTRVGASFVEIMSETYFFKKIHTQDSNLLSLWRALGNGAYAVIPILISIFLYLSHNRNLGYVFPLLSLICLGGVFFAARIKDTM